MFFTPNNRQTRRAKAAHARREARRLAKNTICIADWLCPLCREQPGTIRIADSLCPLCREQPGTIDVKIHAAHGSEKILVFTFCAPCVQDLAYWHHGHGVDELRRRLADTVAPPPDHMPPN